MLSHPLDRAYPFPAKPRVKAGNSIPGCVDRAFHPHTTSPLQRALQSSASQVSGPQHYKFHRQPLPPPGAGAAAARLATQLAAVRLAPAPAAAAPAAPLPEPAAKDAGTQSDYRENEAQTLPWTPGYVLPAPSGARAAKQAAVSGARFCEGPELLQLASLKWGDGLPGIDTWRSQAEHVWACVPLRVARAHVPAAFAAGSLAPAPPPAVLTNSDGNMMSRRNHERA